MENIKHDFASPLWFTALQAILYQAVDEAEDLSGSDWTMCEVFTNVPKSLPQGLDGSIAWHYSLIDGQVKFGFGDQPEADFKVSLDYHVARDMARMVVGNDESIQQEMERIAFAAIEQGKGEVFGSREKRPENLANYHDTIARITR